MQTLKLLGLMLTYPQQDLLAALPEILAFIESEKWLKSKELTKLHVMVSSMQGADLLSLQEEYVSQFDRTPSLSLHMFEHVYGESRDRGPALVELAELYAEQGLFIDSHEMPDYLPLFLEYLSLRPVKEAQDNLNGAIDVVATLSARLSQRKSGYAAVLQALESLATTRPSAKAIQAALDKASGKDRSMAEIDADWEEQEAFANSGIDGDSGCPKAQDILARMHTPEPFAEEVRK